MSNTQIVFKHCQKFKSTNVHFQPKNSKQSFEMALTDVDHLQLHFEDFSFHNINVRNVHGIVVNNKNGRHTNVDT